MLQFQSLGTLPDTLPLPCSGGPRPIAFPPGMPSVGVSDASVPLELTLFLRLDRAASHSRY